MDLTHIRIENGNTRLVTARVALDEINAAMMGEGRKTARQMSAARSSANIEYRDGRKVDIRPATDEEIAEHIAPKDVVLCANCGESIVTQESDPYPWRHPFGHGITADGRTCPKPEPKAASAAPVYRTLKGAKVGDVITLWTRGGQKGPVGEQITVTIAKIAGGWYVTSPDREKPWFLGGTGSKYWVIG